MCRHVYTDCGRTATGEGMINQVQTLGMTHSACPECGRIIPAKVVSDGAAVFFRKCCPEHGHFENKVYGDLRSYLETQRYVKPAWIPREFSGRSDKPCPEGCGFCSRHEQHLCMPIVEITSRCNLDCPICIAQAGGQWEMTPEQFDRIVDNLIRAEAQINILTLSGGEPLLHSSFLAIVDRAVSRPQVIRVVISTNGLELLENPALVGELAKRNVILSLQFDGFDDRAYGVLRGRKLLESKIKILELLEENDLTTSLTVTAAAGVNTDQWPQIIDYFFSHPHVVSMTIQPLAFAGRARGLKGKIERLTIPDLLRLLDAAGGGRVCASDFVPLPCSHPLCFSLAYYLMLDDGGSVALNRLVDASRMLDALSNRAIFGLDSREYERIKDMIYDLWCGPAGTAPQAEPVLKTIRRILDEINRLGFQPRQAFTAAERHIKSIFIHAFQDAETFDLSRVRRCCQAYPQVDGRLIPACVYNVTGARDRSGIPHAIQKE